MIKEQIVCDACGKVQVEEDKLKWYRCRGMIRIGEKDIRLDDTHFCSFNCLVAWLRDKSGLWSGREGVGA